LKALRGRVPIPRSSGSWYKRATAASQHRGMYMDIKSLVGKFGKIAFLLLCILLICMPWLCAFFGVHLPKSIQVVCIFAGMFGLVFFAVIAMKVFFTRS
jgi:hypothetical protein